MNSFSTNSFIGLSFHPDFICMVEMQDGVIQSMAGRELVQTLDIETFYREGQFFENQAEILEDLYQKIGTSGKEVGVALDTGMVLIKKVPLALGLEEEMLKDTIKWEAGQFLVSPLDEYIIDYQRLPFQTPLGNPFYVLILIRRSVLEGVRSFIEEGGLVLRDVDVDVFCNIRTLLSAYDMGTDETSVIVEVQRQYLGFIFIRHREYFLSHRIYLQDSGSVSQTGENISIVNILLKELRRLIFGHGLGRKIEDLNRIFLMGGESVQNVIHELSSAVSVPIEIVNPFQRVRVSQSVSQSREYNGYPEKFVSSVGVTLKKVPIIAE